MLFQVKISENVGKKIFTDKQKNKQGKIYTFGGYKQRNKVCLVYFQVKLPENCAKNTFIKRETKNNVNVTF